MHHAGAHPVIVDVEPDTLNMDPAAVARALTPRTRAVMPVYLHGHPADLDPLLALAKQHGLVVSEDAAHALPARYKGRMVGPPAVKTDADIEEWFRKTAITVHHPCCSNPIGPVLDMADIANDPHFAEREAIVDVGGTPMQNVIAKLSRTPGRLKWHGRGLDADGPEIREKGWNR